MTKCPSCGGPLEIQVLADTDFIQTQVLLRIKSGEYNSLEWKRSTKQPSLSTIAMTDQNRNVPLLSQLYDALKANPNFALKVDTTTYKLSNFNGREYLQRWERIGRVDPSPAPTPQTPKPSPEASAHG